MSVDLVSIIVSTAVPILASSLALVSKYKTDSILKQDEKSEIQEIEVELRKRLNVDDKKDNVLDLMLQNVTELREYYTISKNQARSAFSSALFICFLGICLYALGICGVLFFNKDILLIATIAGTITEVIAGTFFVLYSSSARQLSIYHQRLGYTEKYLTVMQIIKNLSEDKQDEAYNRLIESILADNREIISHEK